MHYAGFWRRVGAAVVDFLVYLPLMIAGLALEGTGPAAAIAYSVATSALYFAYVIVLTAKYGRTIGKWAVGTQVVQVDGRPVTWAHAWRRCAVDLAFNVVLTAGTVLGQLRVSADAYAAAPLEARNALLEQAVPWVGTVMLVYMGWLVAEFVVILANRRRRAVHDFIGGTVVVRSAREWTGEGVGVGMAVA